MANKNYLEKLKQYRKYLQKEIRDYDLALQDPTIKSLPFARLEVNYKKRALEGVVNKLYKLFPEIKPDKPAEDNPETQ